MRKLSRLAEAAEQAGRRVHRLNIGQPDLETPTPLRDAVTSYRDRIYPYLRSEGHHPAIETFRDYYRRRGWELELDQVLVTTGGSEALAFSLQVLCDVGDEVLVPEPCYPSYRTFAAMAGVRLVPVETRVEEGYHLPPLAELEARCSARTRAVLLCNPGNPTGTVYRPDEVERLADLCRRRDLFLVADEVYRDFLFDGARTLGALDLEGMEDRVVVCDSASKRWSICGVRVGCLVTRNPEVAAAALRLARARLAAPLLGQIALAGAEPALEEILSETVAEYQRRRDQLLPIVQAVPGVLAPTPRGAFYAMLRLPVASSEDFSRWLLTDFEEQGETVMLAPGPGFYITPDRGLDEARMAFMLRGPELARCAALLARALEVYPGRRREPREAA